jgi:hypothetical protein
MVRNKMNMKEKTKKKKKKKNDDNSINNVKIFDPLSTHTCCLLFFITFVLVRFQGSESNQWRWLSTIGAGVNGGTSNGLYIGTNGNFPSNQQYRKGKQ